MWYEILDKFTTVPTEENGKNKKLLCFVSEGQRRRKNRIRHKSRLQRSSGMISAQRTCQAATTGELKERRNLRGDSA